MGSDLFESAARDFSLCGYTHNVFRLAKQAALPLNQPQLHRAKTNPACSTQPTFGLIFFGRFLALPENEDYDLQTVT